MGKILSFLLLALLVQSSFATHNLAGDITYKHISGLTYEFTITIFADASSPAVDREEIEINWGDNTGLDSLKVSSQVQVQSSPINIIKRIWKGTHTFPGSAFTYRISVEDPNRNAGVRNMTGSINVPFTIETELLTIPISGEQNNSVQLRNDPIDQACVGSTFIYNAGAFDPDGVDSIAYRLAESKASRNSIAPDFVFPQASVSLTVNPISGDLIWEKPEVAGIYNLAILIIEYRNGIRIGSVLRDIQITVDGNCSNNIPSILSQQLVCIEAGKTLSTAVVGSDTDTMDLVTLTATGEPLESPISPPGAARALFGQRSPNNPITTSFQWNTLCEDVRKRVYTISIKAEDNASARNQVNLVNFRQLNIRVISPGPKNASAIAQGKAINLNWENIECPNASGYYIYRRRGFSGFTPTDCIAGVPDGIGYTKIATIDDVSTTNFIDDNEGLGLIPGQTFCYLITKFFPDGDESYASNEVCAQIEKVVPVITTVSINSTNQTGGTIDLAWSPPSIYDSIAFPEPYKYMIYLERDGLSMLIDSTNNFNDTTYTFQDQNTVNSNFRHRIELYSFGNGKQLIGSTVIASSMFLTINATDQQLTLNWSVDVPWNNNRYVVFRMHPDSANFDSIAQTLTNRFVDTNLMNERRYCYYIKSVGDYNLTNVVSPIVNLSQEACAEPMDNISPCTPTFSLSANCDDGELQMKWNDVSRTCATDAVGYRVYRSDISSSQLILVKEINNPNDTTYIAPKDSVGGCFTISAFDGSGNESTLGERICTEYCPIYELPNVFTPNGDGVNDLFTPIKPYRYVDSIQLNVYNRWGERVFQSNDPAINWDGKHQKIQIKPARDLLNYYNESVSGGVYFYTCEVYEQSLDPLEPRIIKGTITILDPKSIQEKQ